MSRDEIESSTIRPPRRGECRQLAASTTVTVFRAPDEWQGKKVRFEAIGGDFWILVAPDEDLDITPGAVDTVDGTTLSDALDDIGEKIPNGLYKEFDFFASDRYVAVVSSDAVGVLFFRPAEVALGST